MTGFEWEGFARSLQTNITTIVILAIIAYIAYRIAIWFINETYNAEATAEELQRVLSLAKKTLFGAYALLAAGFVMNAVLVAATNRIPRSDVDKSGVYQQIDSHLSAPDH